MKQLRAEVIDAHSDAWPMTAPLDVGDSRSLAPANGHCAIVSIPQFHRAIHRGSRYKPGVSVMRVKRYS